MNFSTWDSVQTKRLRKAFNPARVTVEFSRTAPQKIFSHVLGQIDFTEVKDLNPPREQVIAQELSSFKYPNVSHVFTSVVITSPETSGEFLVYAHGAQVGGLTPNKESCSVLGLKCASGEGNDDVCNVAKCIIGELERVKNTKWVYRSEATDVQYYLPGPKSARLKTLLRGSFEGVAVDAAASVSSVVYFPPKHYFSEDFIETALIRIDERLDTPSKVIGIENRKQRFAQKVLMLAYPQVTEGFVNSQAYNAMNVAELKKTLLEVFSSIDDVWFNAITQIVNSDSSALPIDLVLSVYDQVDDLFSKLIQVIPSSMAKASYSFAKEQIARPVYSRLPGLAEAYRTDPAFSDLEPPAQWLTSGVDEFLSEKKDQIAAFYEDFLDPDTCTPLVLDWLAQHVGLTGELWDSSWENSIKVGMIKNAFGWWDKSKAVSIPGLGESKTPKGEVLSEFPFTEDIWVDEETEDNLLDISFAEIEKIQVDEDDNVVGADFYMEKQYDEDSGLVSLVPAEKVKISKDKWNGLMEAKGSLLGVAFLCSLFGLKAHSPEELEVINLERRIFKPRTGLRSAEVGAPTLLPYKPEVIQVGTEDDAAISNFANQLVAGVSRFASIEDSKNVIFRVPYYYNRNGRSWRATEYIARAWLPNNLNARVQHPYLSAGLWACGDAFFNPEASTPTSTSPVGCAGDFIDAPTSSFVLAHGPQAIESEVTGYTNELLDYTDYYVGDNYENSQMCESNTLGNTITAMIRYGGSWGVIGTERIRLEERNPSGQLVKSSSLVSTVVRGTGYVMLERHSSGSGYVMSSSSTVSATRVQVDLYFLDNDLEIVSSRTFTPTSTPISPRTETRIACTADGSIWLALQAWSASSSLGQSITIFRLNSSLQDLVSPKRLQAESGFSFESNRVFAMSNIETSNTDILFAVRARIGATQTSRLVYTRLDSSISEVWKKSFSTSDILPAEPTTSVSRYSYFHVLTTDANSNGYIAFTLGDNVVNQSGGNSGVHIHKFNVDTGADTASAQVRINAPNYHAWWGTPEEYPNTEVSLVQDIKVLPSGAIVVLFWMIGGVDNWGETSGFFTISPGLTLVSNSVELAPYVGPKRGAYFYNLLYSNRILADETGFWISSTSNCGRETWTKNNMGAYWLPTLHRVNYSSIQDGSVFGNYGEKEGKWIAPGRASLQTPEVTITSANSTATSLTLSPSWVADVVPQPMVQQNPGVVTAYPTILWNKNIKPLGTGLPAINPREIIYTQSGVEITYDEFGDPVDYPLGTIYNLQDEDKTTGTVTIWGWGEDNGTNEAAFIQMDFGQVCRVDQIVVGGDADQLDGYAPEDYLSFNVLSASADGENWYHVGDVGLLLDGIKTLGCFNISARYLRLHGGQWENWNVAATEFYATTYAQPLPPMPAP